MKRSLFFLVLISQFSFSQVVDSLTIDSLTIDTLKVSDTLITKPDHSIDDVVITGTMRPISKSKSPIPVEIYTSRFFNKNPSPNIFESIAMVNGIRPQLNCSVCNTGDIHINGLEGAYTMILIDGMPIVSSLSTVYGLSGIPNSIIDRIEVVKGPASSLYGSEAMGGVINIITKNAMTLPRLSVDLRTDSWQEHNIDVASKFNVGERISSMLSFNYFNFKNKLDLNNDNFTDASLQDRISIFNKWNFKREDNKVASFATRYLYEDRFGGEMDWDKSHRGGNTIYGESVYTNRFELFGIYQWPTKENIFTRFSYNYHHQDSYYGQTQFNATQKVLFGQTYWDKKLGNHNILLGASYKHNYYDDNTVGTQDANGNQPMRSPIFGVFLQDQWELSEQNSLLFGYRYDYHDVHKGVHSPRLAWKFSPNPSHIFRLSFGTGFRVVNLFTEDHAAITGSRDVVILNELKPEKSINTNFNYVFKLPINDRIMNLDASVFYTRFSNKIVGDFDTDPTKIIYDNLSGYGISKGASLNLDYTFGFPLTLNLGVTYMDVYQKSEADNHKKQQQLHSPKWSGTYNISYKFPKDFNIDFTGQIYGPMRLPVFENDYRPEFSPWYSLANVQVSKKFNSGFEIYGGVKNLFNFVPDSPIMRAFDPFDNNVNVDNPNNYTFDTTYGYAPLQGLRGYLGIKFNLK